MEALDGRPDHLLHGFQVVVHALLVHEGQSRQGPQVELFVAIHAEGEEPAGFRHEAGLLE